MKAAFLLAKSVVPHMQNQGKGSIVLISSIGGFHPIPVSIKSTMASDRNISMHTILEFLLEYSVLSSNFGGNLKLL